jgi:hypothetical protein
VRLAHLIVVSAMLAVVIVPARADVAADTCAATLIVSYPEAAELTPVDGTVRVFVTFGANETRGTTHLLIDRLRFNLDCPDSAVFLYCPDDGAVVSYQGNITTTCGVTITASHAPGDTFPNQVVFTADPPIVIPEFTPEFCMFAFDVRIETRSHDATPDVVEQLAGFDASLADGYCDSFPNISTGVTVTGSIPLCPDCAGGGCNEACAIAECLACPLENDGKAAICHQPSGDGHAGHTLRVPHDALEGHCAHGDSCGACEKP